MDGWIESIMLLIRVMTPNTGRMLAKFSTATRKQDYLAYQYNTYKIIKIVMLLNCTTITYLVIILQSITMHRLKNTPKDSWTLQ